MKYFFSALCFYLLSFNTGYCQQVKFNLVLEQSSNIIAMAQDPQGYIWYGTNIKGLFRYDGIENKAFTHDDLNSNSLTSNYVECLSIDSSGIIWIGTFNAGLDRFDPSTNTFKHFRHNPKDIQSLASDTIAAILEDHLGNLWLGTYGGLDMFDKKTGKFTHYANEPGDEQSLSYNHVRVIYEDKAGTLWVGCGSPFNGDNETPQTGGLNRFDRTTGKFTRYLHNPGNPASITTNKVRAILEDSKGNFWIGTSGDGLHTMDRKTGTFTHYYYDSTNPGKLSRPVLYRAVPVDHISFITEDVTGAIWIGSFFEGINRYDPATKKITHHGLFVQDGKVISYKDTLTGLKHAGVWKSIISKDGLLWICTTEGAIYNVNPLKTTIPFYDVNNGLDANTFYYEKKGNILWIGTDRGLIRKNLSNQSQKIWLHDPQNKNSLANDTIAAMRADAQGNLWMTTNDGFCKFDRLNTFTTFRHIEGDPKSLSNNALLNLYIDNQRIWIATNGTGMDMLDLSTSTFTNYRFNRKDSNSLSNNQVISICSGGPGKVWVGTSIGLNSLDIKSGKCRRYLLNSSVKNMFVDAAGITWAGAVEGLYYFDKSNDQFIFYLHPDTKSPIAEVLHIMEDAQQNLWVSTANSIVKINAKRDKIKVYGESYGIHKNTYLFSDNFIGENGQLFIGDQDGYYSFFPEQLKDNDQPPLVTLRSFRLGDMEVNPGPGSVLNVPIWQAKEIKLGHNQNVFSFDFNAISYTHQGERKFLFRLENYDNTWHSIGTDHKAYFFNVPPGNYTFRVRSIIGEGNWGETSVRIIITPPWWRTWWAYTLFGLLFIGTISAFMYWRSKALRRENRLLEEKVTHRTIQLQQSIDQLKATQSQLIQSEKMASLGELTAGIAHEIQNPLNFVNNFSEVNTELIEELKSEKSKVKSERNEELEDELLNDIAQNLEKINHHGKRADAIVKGMLQHSRSSSSQKEPTDINALCDEYLRLCYHGLRAKDKSFNATIKTDFDETIGKINIIPQDIGRVILNLLTNAFYAVNEKQKQNPQPLGSEKTYEPTVAITTRSIKPPSGSQAVEIKVIDNGGGIPKKALDKIFQPFFTTKPTGQGTGLGLSLSYDIVKAHGGELKVETKETEGTIFTIELPA